MVYIFNGYDDIFFSHLFIQNWCPCIYCSKLSIYLPIHLRVRHPTGFVDTTVMCRSCLIRKQDSKRLPMNKQYGQSRKGKSGKGMQRDDTHKKTSA